MARLGKVGFKPCALTWGQSQVRYPNYGDTMNLEKTMDAWTDYQTWPRIYIDQNGTIHTDCPENVPVIIKRIPPHIMKHYPNLKAVEHKDRIIITITAGRD